ncbi:MAG: trimethylamine methyltransferase family protein [Rhodobacteraceae bacterium]|nr:trimethylamine methyltransferase family protein [Paracoccaceae bacterium]
MRRAGGRAARKAMRAAPLVDEMKPVRSGMEGGQYKPLSPDDIEKIHESVLEILETIGIKSATPACIKACTKVGATFENERLLFPRQLVLDTIKIANRDLTLCGRTPEHDIKPQGTKVHFGTAGAAVHMVNAKTGEYRESQLQDLYDAARIVDNMDNIHFFQRPLVPRDVLGELNMDINTLYASLSGTRKHVGTSITLVENCKPFLEMLYMVAGGEAAFRARPFVSISATFVVPPLRFAVEALDVIGEMVKGGVPVLLLSAGQAGATSPAALAGSVVQSLAEVLAGLVYVNALQPGAPAIFGPWPFVSDLRTGAMSGGSGEQSLLIAAVTQMTNFYNLPCGVPAGMTDAKLPDIQSGYEKGCTTVMAGLAGGNLIYEAAGMHASLLGFCHESLIIDNDILGQSLRCVRGIEVNKDTLSLDTIRDVCLGGPEHFLGQPQTLNLMQREYIYPEIGDRTTPKEWEELQKPKMLDKAIAKKRQILEGYFPSHISDKLDAEIRAKFDIKLPRAAMKKA